jgi:transcriptional regulator with XRE-family HTH domain
MAPSDQPQPALGKAIRQLREKRGATQEAVAHDAGITTATLGVIERGLSNPTWATVKGIAAALDVSIVELAKAATTVEAA